MVGEGVDDVVGDVGLGVVGVVGGVGAVGPFVGKLVGAWLRLGNGVGGLVDATTSIGFVSTVTDEPRFVCTAASNVEAESSVDTVVDSASTSSSCLTTSKLADHTTVLKRPRRWR